MVLGVLLFVTWAVLMMCKAESLEDVKAESPEDATIGELSHRTSDANFAYNFNAKATAASSRFRIRRITKLNNKRLEDAYKVHIHAHHFT